jgi:hypothetical protein
MMDDIDRLFVTDRETQKFACHMTLSLIWTVDHDTRLNISLISLERYCIYLYSVSQIVIVVVFLDDSEW